MVQKTCKLDTIEQNYNPIESTYKLIVGILTAMRNNCVTLLLFVVILLEKRKTQRKIERNFQSFLIVLFVCVSSCLRKHIGTVQTHYMSSDQRNCFKERMLKCACFCEFKDISYVMLLQARKFIVNCGLKMPKFGKAMSNFFWKLNFTV